MRNWKTLLLATAVSCVGLSSASHAQFLYAGGATFPAPTYRYLADCWGVQVDGNPPAGGPTGYIAAFPISPSCGSPTGDSSGLLAQILYAPVGSGGGKRALRNHDASLAATGLGTPAAANPVPFVSSQEYTYVGAYPYPTFHFAGSDDVWTSADVTAYNGNGGPAKYGRIIEIPALAGAVTIGFNGKDGTGAPLTITHAIPAGGSSGLNLSRQAMCGIFTGHITKWNNPILTALNGGVDLGTGQITVVHRSDGSGTTFLFTQGMYAQCVGQSGPNSETDPTTASYEFTWSDRNVNVCPALFHRPSNLLDWPDLGTTLCGSAIPAVPGVFVGANGNGTVVSTISTTNGAIGYTTTDYTQPVVATGPANANLQSQYDVDNSTGLYNPPTIANITTAMSTAFPNMPNDAVLGNALNWSTQGVVPNPDAPGSYPIAGYTWFDFYQCYSDPTVKQNIFSYLQFHYTDAAAAAIINSQGFATIPGNWFSVVAQTVTSPTIGMGVAGSGTCSAVGPGA